MEGQCVEKKNDQTGQKRPLNKAGIVAAAAVAVVLGGYLGLCAWVGGDRLMPNTAIAGVDVSRMTWEEAYGAVNQALKEHSHEAVVTLTYGDWSGTITGDQLDTSRESDPEALAEQYQGSFLTRGVRYLSALTGKTTEIPLDMKDVEQDDAKHEVLSGLLDEADLAAGGDKTAATYTVKDNKLVVTKGVTSYSIDREKALEDVLTSFQSLMPSILRGQEIAGTVELTAVETPPQTPDYDAIHAELYCEAKDAYMNTNHKIENHVVGVDFQVDDLKAAYERAGEGKNFEVDLKLTQPKITKAKLEASLFKDLLGSATSTVSGTANRKSNVKLSAAACNGVILLPGEEFSYNNTTGSRTAAKGYLPAGVYVGGASVDEVGGGICQTSSTIYYAVLHTTLQVTERHDHKYAVGYVPDGMDATVYYGSLDFRFKNNTNYPIKIVTSSYDSGGSRKLTVKIYGTNETGYYGVPKNEVYDRVEPTTTYVADKTVARGTLVLDRKQNPYTGRKARTYRYIYDKNGNLVEKQTMTASKYDMRPKVYYYNPADGSPSSWPNGQPPKPNTDPDTSVDTKPDTKPETKPDTKPETKPSDPDTSGTETSGGSETQETT